MSVTSSAMTSFPEKRDILQISSRIKSGLAIINDKVDISSQISRHSPRLKLGFGPPSLLYQIRNETMLSIFVPKDT